MTRELEDAGIAVEGFQVQCMAPAGTEMIVGAVGDPAFGPLVARGAGGVAVELLGDVQVRLAPLGPREAAAHPAVAELDLNPVIATPDGAVVVDARVRLEAPGRAAPFPSRNALSARKSAYARHVV